jgi:hypothetical protein
VDLNLNLSYYIRKLICKINQQDSLSNNLSEISHETIKSENFSDIITALYNNGKPASVIDPKLHEFLMKNKDHMDEILIKNKDHLNEIDTLKRI